MLHPPFVVIANVFPATPSLVGQGLWEQLREPVSLTPIADKKHERELLDLAHYAGERYVLLVDANRIAYLVATAGDVPDVRLGQWQELTPAEADQRDAWTCIDGRYFAAV